MAAGQIPRRAAGIVPISYCHRADVSVRAVIVRTIPQRRKGAAPTSVGWSDGGAVGELIQCAPPLRRLPQLSVSHRKEEKNR